MEWAIGAVTAAQAFGEVVQPTAAGTQPANDAFGNLIRSGLSELNSSVGAAEGAMRDLAAGKPVELHAVMISLEEARLSVQTFVQVRNKLVESYQDLTRMQI